VKAPWAFRKGRKNERHGGYRGRWYYQVIQGDMYVIHEGEYFLLMFWSSIVQGQCVIRGKM